MGADFITRIAWHPRHDKVDWEAGQKYIDGLTAETLQAELEREGREDNLSWWDQFSPFDSFDHSLQAIRDAYAECKNAFDDGHDREAGVLWVGDATTVWITGGMSWGDPPTQLYEAMEMLEISGVMRAMGLFQEGGELGVAYAKAGSVMQALARVLIDRGYDEPTIREAMLDHANAIESDLWESHIGPLVDRIAVWIGLPPYPVESEAEVAR